MSYELTIDTPPAAATTLISLADVKKHVRVETAETYHDDELTAFLEAAVEYVAESTDTTLLQTVYKLTLDRFPKKGTDLIYLPRPPLISVDTVDYYDTNGDQVAGLPVQSSTGFRSTICPAIDQCWPATRVQKNAVTIEYTAGYATPADVPRRAVQAILLIAGHWFRNRETAAEKTLTEIPHAAEMLIAQLRPGDDFHRPDHDYNK